jgi:hypothetical protein
MKIWNRQGRPCLFFLAIPKKGFIIKKKTGGGSNESVAAF